MLIIAAQDADKYWRTKMKIKNQELKLFGLLIGCVIVAVVTKDYSAAWLMGYTYLMAYVWFVIVK